MNHDQRELDWTESAGILFKVITSGSSMLTQPEDEESNHSTSGYTDMFGDSVRDPVKRWPD